VCLLFFLFRSGRIVKAPDRRPCQKHVAAIRSWPDTNYVRPVQRGVNVGERKPVVVDQRSGRTAGISEAFLVPCLEESMRISDGGRGSYRDAPPDD
jgi:hypothetical protein